MNEHRTVEGGSCVISYVSPILYTGRSQCVIMIVYTYLLLTFFWFLVLVCRHGTELMISSVIYMFFNGRPVMDLHAVTTGSFLYDWIFQ